MSILDMLKPKPTNEDDRSTKACPNCRRVGAWSEPAVFVQLDRRRAIERRYCVCGLPLISWRTATRAEIKAQKKLEKKRK